MVLEPLVLDPSTMNYIPKLSSIDYPLPLKFLPIVLRSMYSNDFCPLLDMMKWTWTDLIMWDPM